MMRPWLFFVILLAGCVAPLAPPVPVPSPSPGPVIPTPPAPVVSAERVVLVIHETAEQSPAFSRLRNDLVALGEPQKYLASKQHALAILDVQSTDPDGKPLSVIEFVKPSISGKTLPVLVVCEKTGNKIGKVLLVESLRPDATADNVIELVKRSGG